MYICHVLTDTCRNFALYNGLRHVSNKGIIPNLRKTVLKCVYELETRSLRGSKSMPPSRHKRCLVQIINALKLGGGGSTRTQRKDRYI